MLPFFRILLENARLSATYSSGLIGSIHAMTATANVAGEIIRTHDHVHTLKDELLAWKIKKAAGQGTTVGDALEFGQINSSSGSKTECFPGEFQAEGHEKAAVFDHFFP